MGRGRNVETLAMGTSMAVILNAYATVRRESHAPSGRPARNCDMHDQMVRRVEVARNPEEATGLSSTSSRRTAVVQATTWPGRIHRTRYHWCLGDENGEKEDAADWK